MFIFTIIAGTIIACSSGSWFTCWLGLEINLIRLIPLLVIKLNPLSTETAIKYFIAQAIASLLLIFSSLIGARVGFLRLLGIQKEIIFIALRLKAGMAPFHFWFPQIIKISDWPQCAIVLTWQKIAPFILLSSVTQTKTVFIVIIGSAIVGRLGGLNQINLKIILTYSSIAHARWMLAICEASSIFYWAAYFLIYCAISIRLIFILYTTRIKIVRQIITRKWRTSLKYSFTLRLLSLGGLPPFIGFIAKLGAIYIIVLKLRIFLAAALVTSSLVSLFYYLRIAYRLLIGERKNNFITVAHSNSSDKLFLTVSILGNCMAPILVFLV